MHLFKSFESRISIAPGSTDLRALIKSWDKLKLPACKNKSALLMSSYRLLRNKVNSLSINSNGSILQLEFQSSKAI